MKRLLEEDLTQLFSSNIDIIGEGLPNEINSCREYFLERLNALKLPSAKDEKYRHYDLRELFDGDWEYYFTPQKEQMTISRRVPIEGYRLDVINGFYQEREEIVELENGVVYGSLRGAMSSHLRVVAEHYNSAADNEYTAVTALNSAFMQDGAFVYVPRGVKVDKPFVLTFEYGSAEEAQMSFGRVLIVVEDGAEADIVLSHQDRGGVNFLVNFVRETIVGEGARVNIVEISDFSQESAIVSGTYLRQAKDSAVNVQNLWVKGGATRLNAITNLEGRGCESNLYGLFLGSNEERTDITIDVRHLEPDCTSNELLKGVVSGSAVGAFTGKIYVAQDAQRTLAFQQSRNLQLSDSSRIYAEPQLEIYADDVKCSHGATVGQMDSDAVYYMQQRGLSLEDAKKMLLLGFVNDVINRCPIESLYDYMHEITSNRIEQL